MTSTVHSAEETGRPRTFDSVDPATGQTIDTYPVHGGDDVAAAVERARQAASWWAGLGWKERRKRLLRWRVALTRYQHRLAELVHAETGKPIPDAQLEVLLAIVHLDWAAKHARKVLGPRRVLPGLLGANHAASVEYQPLGVVGVIGPWNYPVFTTMGSIAYALAAGNAVVFKPSEYTPGVGRELVNLFAGVVDEQPVFQLVTGYGETGAALASSRLHKVAFTGSTATAKKVMAACAENLTPVLAECGGKDALIVDEGANLDAAAQASVWGAMANAGQTCVGIERIYAVESVHDAFVAKLTEQARKLRPGNDGMADYGPITRPEQIDVINEHVTDALARGGRALVGGTESVHAPYVDPVVLVDVPADAPANRKETFGPTVTVSKVTNLAEAIERANDSGYGLGSAIFSGNKHRAVSAARRLRSGMTAINSVISFAAIPTLPFGGVDDSGHGRIHGPDGLRAFARAKATSRQLFPLPINPQSFGEQSRKAMKLLTTAATVLYSKRPR